MLFHITAQHDHLTCSGVAARKAGGSLAESQRETNRWLEGNDKIKVIYAHSNNPSHRMFAVVETDDWDALNELTNQFKDVGSCDVQPCGDAIARRHAQGNWGK